MAEIRPVRAEDQEVPIPADHLELTDGQSGLTLMLQHTSPGQEHLAIALRMVVSETAPGGEKTTFVQASLSFDELVAGLLMLAISLPQGHRLIQVREPGVEKDRLL